jgi:high affinity sulfate transporter 1
MAYATIAGLPVQVGLYTAVVPMLAYALLGTSRALSVSTASAIAALTGAGVATVAHGDAGRALAAASMLALLTGALPLGAGALKLGFLADFISRPVLAGFKAGTGLLIAAGQLGKVLGIPQEGDNFFEKMWSAIEQLGDIQWATAAVAAGTLAILLGFKRWAPPSVPGPLIAVGAGIALAAVADLEGAGVELVGDIPSGLPAFALPDLGLIGPLLPAAAGVALMAFVESISAGRTFVRAGEREVDPDSELRALGGANVAGGLFQSMPAGGGLSQSAVNDAAGARTPLAGASSAVVGALLLLFFTDLFADLPQATLGALVLVAALGLVDVDALRRIRSAREVGFVAGLITLVGVLALGVLDGVLIGVLASMLLLVHSLDRPAIPVLGRRPGSATWRALADHPGDETVPGLLVVRVVGPIYFANAQRLRRRLLDLIGGAPERPRHFLMDMAAVT